MTVLCALAQLEVRHCSWSSTREGTHRACARTIARGLPPPWSAVSLATRRCGRSHAWRHRPREENVARQSQSITRPLTWRRRSATYAAWNPKSCSACRAAGSASGSDLYRWDDDRSQMLLSARLPARSGCTGDQSTGQCHERQSGSLRHGREHFAKTGSADVPAGTPVDKSSERAMGRQAGRCSRSYLRRVSWSTVQKP